MINKIKGLRKYTDCSMPSNETERISKAEVAAYNQAIEDLIFAIPAVVGQSEQFYCTCSRAKGLDHDEEGKPYCIECQKPVLADSLPLDGDKAWDTFIVR